MSGAVLVLAAAAGGVPAGGGGPGTLAWSDIYGVDSAFTQALTLSGFSGPLNLAAGQIGGGGLYAVLNGAGFAYVGPFTVQAGDTVGWGVVLSGRVGRSGTITVTNAGSGAGLAVIHYQVLTSGIGLQ